MEFEWDENKEQADLEKHGIDFEQAKAVFEDINLLTFEDNRFEYGELREISIGQIPLVTQQKIIVAVVVHTERNGITRLISVRKATKQERRMYEQAKIFPDMSLEEREKQLLEMSDEDIDYSDIPPLDENFLKNAKLIKRSPRTEQISIRIDTNVLEWFKNHAEGKGYQTFINEVLRTYVKHNS